MPNGLEEFPKIAFAAKRITTNISVTGLVSNEAELEAYKKSVEMAYAHLQNLGTPSVVYQS